VGVRGGARRARGTLEPFLKKGFKLPKTFKKDVFDNLKGCLFDRTD
jgi:hypothetical protein